MKTLVLVMAVLAVASGAVYSQAAAQTRYDRNLIIFDPDASGSGVVVSHDCRVDGTGSFSFIANGAMEENGNPVTVTGSVVIAADKTTIQYVKSFSGQWVEQTPEW